MKGSWLEKNCPHDRDANPVRYIFNEDGWGIIRLCGQFDLSLTAYLFEKLVVNSQTMSLGGKIISPQSQWSLYANDEQLGSKSMQGCLEKPW